MNKRGTRVALAGIVAAALLVPVSSSLNAALACSAAPGPQRTIEVQAKALTDVVKRGDVAKIEVKTYRPAQEDFAGTGVSFPAGTVPMQPAGEIPFTLGVLTGDGYIYQNIASETDETGTRVVKMKLKKYHTPGSAGLRVRAFRDHTSGMDTQCVEIQEYGYIQKEDAFIVR